MCGQVIGSRLTFSIILDRKGKLDTGLKFLKVGSASVFFGRGITTACLSPSGILPCMSDLFITLLHDFGAADKINFLISSLLRGWKQVSGVRSTVLSYSWNLLVDRNLALIFMIFFSK